MCDNLPRSTLPTVIFIGVKLNSRCFSMKWKSLFIFDGKLFFFECIFLQKPFRTFAHLSRNNGIPRQ